MFRFKSFDLTSLPLRLDQLSIFRKKRRERDRGSLGDVEENSTVGRIREQTNSLRDHLGLVDVFVFYTSVGNVFIKLLGWNTIQYKVTEPSL